MLKQLTALITVLLITGISLTLYLPDYEPENAIRLAPPNYQISQESLKNPFAMNDTLLNALEQEGSRFGLRLGLFGQLQQAVDQGAKYALTDKPTIFKTTDNQRYWYLLVLGPFPDRFQANHRSLSLAQNQHISSTLMRWPSENLSTKTPTKAPTKAPPADDKAESTSASQPSAQVNTESAS